MNPSRGGGRWVAPAVIAATVSGAPSTLHAVLSGRSPLAAVHAAGTLVVPEHAGPGTRLLAGAFVHVGVSLLWAGVLARVLPGRRTVTVGAVAGLLIAAIDLGVVGRQRPAIRALPLLPQLADHALFGAIVGAGLSRRRYAARAARTG